MNALRAWLRGNAIWLALMAVALGLLIAGLRMGGVPTSVPERVGVPPDGHTAIKPSLAPVGGDFDFVSAESGEPTRLSEQPPAWRWIYFGYMSCPDVCPSSLAMIRQALNELDGSTAVEGLFVSLDPERDRPEMVRDYAAYFHPAIRGGVVSDVASEVQPRYAVVAERVDLDGSAMGYAIDHTSSVYLVDPQNRLRHVHAHGATARELLEVLEQAQPMTSTPVPLGRAMVGPALKRPVHLIIPPPGDADAWSFVGLTSIGAPGSFEDDSGGR